MPKKKNTNNTYKTEWDLSIFYTSEKDPRIEKDIKKLEKQYAAFSKKYQRSTSWSVQPKKLAAALKDYEKLMVSEDGSKPLIYFAYRRELNAKDTAAEQQLNLISQRLTKLFNTILFFELTLGKLPKKKQNILLKHPSLQEYHYFLKRVFLEATHDLSEQEEKIMSLKSMPSHDLWVNATEKIVSNRIVQFEKKKLPLPEAFETVKKLPKIKRRKLWNTITDELHAIAETAEHEMNAIVISKKINDELRGYKHPYSATIEGYNNSEKSIEALVNAVSNKGFRISKQFYTLKAKLLAEKQIQYIDRVATPYKEIPMPFSTSVTQLREIFYGIKNEYGEILDRMLAQGQVDVFPRKGKSGGAFCSGSINQPTFVFLNHTDDTRSFSTFAHEMGHAIHTERSKKQRPLYQGYTISAAETASTFFENVVFEKMLETFTPQQQISALHQKLDDMVATVMRQIAFFNFELNLHTAIRQQGSLTREDMARMYTKHIKKYLGSAVHMTEKDGYEFVYVGHFRRFFYVYSYAYGILISSVMADRWKRDPSYINQIDTFLTAGGSETPDQIFKDIGINTTKVDFFEKGLDAVDMQVQRLKKLTRPKK